MGTINTSCQPSTESLATFCINIILIHQNEYIVFNSTLSRLISAPLDINPRFEMVAANACHTYSLRKCTASSKLTTIVSASSATLSL